MVKKYIHITSALKVRKCSYLETGVLMGRLREVFCVGKFFRMHSFIGLKTFFANIIIILLMYMYVVLNSFKVVLCGLKICKCISIYLYI